MAPIPTFIAVPGLNVSLWTIVGAVRFLKEEVISPRILTSSEKNLVNWMKKNAVAVCIPARNEELGIARTIKSLINQVGPKNIYVASDGSTDKTAKVAKKFKVNVAELSPNRGKAGALAYLINDYQLFEKYLFILFVDADTHIDKSYLKVALPYFADPQVVVVAGHGVTDWQKHYLPKMKMFYVAYRDRLYNFLQFAIRYGQTFSSTNVSPIVPGFASIYRTQALKKIDITTPGLVIEDFNMTFQIHHKKLGKIAYHPKAYGIARDPTTFWDYWNQVRRWNLGFWQTVIKHGFWPSFFSIALGAFIIESLLAASFFYMLPVLTFLLSMQYYPQFFSPQFVSISQAINSYVSLKDIFIIFVAADYLLTSFVALFVKRPLHLVYGLGFPILRFIDAILILSTLPQALFTKSSGSWTPPKREI